VRCPCCTSPFAYATSEPGENISPGTLVSMVIWDCNLRRSSVDAQLQAHYSDSVFRLGHYNARFAARRYAKLI
jgi:hypothetical protein